MVAPPHGRPPLPAIVLLAPHVLWCSPRAVLHRFREEIFKAREHGMPFKLELFETTTGCGFGLRVLEDFIPEGSFLLEYLGELISATEVGGCGTWDRTWKWERSWEQLVCVLRRSTRTRCETMRAQPHPQLCFQRPLTFVLPTPLARLTGHL